MDAGDPDGDSDFALREIRESLGSAASGGSEGPAAWTAASRRLEDATSRLDERGRAELGRELRGIVADAGAGYAVLRRCVVVLRELGDVETLSELATDPRRDRRLARQAAEAVIAAAPDAASVARLFGSEQPGVLVVALRWAAENGAQDAAHQRLVELCESDEAAVRAAAVRAVALDAEPARAAANAQAIASSIRGARAALPEVAVATASGFSAFEDFMSNASRYIGDSRGDREVLLAAIADIGGEEGVFVAAGRARLGDRSVHDALVDALVDANSPAARRCAAVGLAAIGDASDLDVLERVAREDPFHVATHRGNSYLVRDACERAVSEIRTRLSEQ